MPDTHATDDATQSILELIKLYALDTQDQRAILNKVAWTLRENGWGLLGGSDRHLANVVTGRTYQVGILPDGLSLIPLGELDHSQFVDPTEDPLPAPPAAPVAPVEPGTDTMQPPTMQPQTPLAFLKRRIDAPPQTPDERMEAIDQKLDAILGMYETLMHLLDSFHERQGQSYTGETRLMGRRVIITLTPIEPKP